MIAKVGLILVIASMVNADGMLVDHGHHVPQPYKFGYNVKDKHGEQHRQESGNGAGGVVGSYGFTDARGVNRQVNYVADHAGFRAQVKTNEPGTANQDPAAVNIISSAHPYYGAGYGIGAVGLGAGIGIGGYGAGIGAGFAAGAGGVGLGYGAPVAGLGLGGYGGLGVGNGAYALY